MPGGAGTRRATGNRICRSRRPVTRPGTAPLARAMTALALDAGVLAAWVTGDETSDAI